MGWIFSKLFSKLNTGSKGLKRLCCFMKMAFTTVRKKAWQREWWYLKIHNLFASLMTHHCNMISFVTWKALFVQKHRMYFNDNWKSSFYYVWSNICTIKAIPAVHCLSSWDVAALSAPVCCGHQEVTWITESTPKVSKVIILRIPIN